MTDQQNVTLRDFFEEKFKRLEEQNDTQIALGKASLAEQRLTNGRLRAAEKAIAVLQVGYVVGGVVIAGVGAWLLAKLP